MIEIVVISGKGGTGKTTVSAAFARFAQPAVLADCDVDAADLHLVLSPREAEWRPFSTRHRAVVDEQLCSACGRCVDHCRFAAVTLDPPTIDPVACEGCGLCVRLCPERAISMQPVTSGEWASSETPFGPLIHARLHAAEDNSGKLVTLVREKARGIAHEHDSELVLVDGAPGIGCPVIASLAGATIALIVTEPTVSGRHDLRRVIELARHLRLPFAVCVNKADVNLRSSGQLAEEATEAGALFVATVRYDIAVTTAMVAGGSIVDGRAGGTTRDRACRGGAAEDLVSLWQQTIAAATRVSSSDRRARPVTPDLHVTLSHTPTPMEKRTQ